MYILSTRHQGIENEIISVVRRNKQVYNEVRCAQCSNVVNIAHGYECRLESDCLGPNPAPPLTKCMTKENLSALPLVFVCLFCCFLSEIEMISTYLIELL